MVLFWQLQPGLPLPVGTAESKGCYQKHQDYKPALVYMSSSSPHPAFPVRQGCCRLQQRHSALLHNHKFLTTQCHVHRKMLKSNQVTENKHHKEKVGNILRKVPLQTSQSVADRVNIHPAPRCRATKEKTNHQGSAPRCSHGAANGQSDTTSQSPTQSQTSGGTGWFTLAPASCCIWLRWNQIYTECESGAPQDSCFCHTLFTPPKSQ